MYAGARQFSSTLLQRPADPLLVCCSQVSAVCVAVHDAGSLAGAFEETWAGAAIAVNSNIAHDDVTWSSGATAGTTTAARSASLVVFYCPDTVTAGCVRDGQVDGALCCAVSRRREVMDHKSVAVRGLDWLQAPDQQSMPLCLWPCIFTPDSEHSRNLRCAAHSVAYVRLPASDRSIAQNALEGVFPSLLRRYPPCDPCQLLQFKGQTNVHIEAAQTQYPLAPCASWDPGDS